MLNWQYYPKSSQVNHTLKNIISICENNISSIESPNNTLESNDVLEILRHSLEEIGFAVEKSKKKSDKIQVPVLFGRNGRLEKFFDADAYHAKEGIVFEVEAGRAVTNYQFLKDLFQACMMYNVKFLAIAVRNEYRDKKDFEKVMSFFDALYASNRIILPLEGVLVIGY